MKEYVVKSAVALAVVGPGIVGIVSLSDSIVGML